MSRERITADEVVEAYKKTGLRPRKGEWTNDGCACPLAVVAAMNNVGDAFGHDDHEIECWAIAKYGRPYVRGFTSGVDGDELYAVLAGYDFDDDDERRCKQGHRDGRRAWHAVYMDQATNKPQDSRSDSEP